MRLLPQDQIQYLAQSPQRVEVEAAVQTTQQRQLPEVLVVEAARLILHIHKMAPLEIHRQHLHRKEIMVGMVLAVIRMLTFNVLVVAAAHPP